MNSQHPVPSTQQILSKICWMNGWSTSMLRSGGGKSIWLRGWDHRQLEKASCRKEYGMKRTLRGDLREMTQGKLGSKVDLGNTLAPLVPIYMEGSWWRDPGRQVGFAESQKPWQALKRHMVLPQPSGQGPLFIYFFLCLSSPYWASVTCQALCWVLHIQWWT